MLDDAAHVVVFLPGGGYHCWLYNGLVEGNTRWIWCRERSIMKAEISVIVTRGEGAVIWATYHDRQQNVQYSNEQKSCDGLGCVFFWW